MRGKTRWEREGRLSGPQDLVRGGRGSRGSGGYGRVASAQLQSIYATCECGPKVINLKEIIMVKSIPLKLLLYMHSNRASSAPHLNNSGRWDSSPVFRHKPRKEPMHMSAGIMTRASLLLESAIIPTPSPVSATCYLTAVIRKRFSDVRTTRIGVVSDAVQAFASIRFQFLPISSQCIVYAV